MYLKIMKKIIDLILGNFIWIIVIIMILPVLFLKKRRTKELHRAKQQLKKSIVDQLDEPTTLHPEIDPLLCSGCGTCVQACPEGEILGLVNHKAVLVSPSKCVGHGECEKVCPMDAIKLVFGTKKRGMNIPRLNKNYETNISGLYIAGELGGMGLIRNATKQGTLAAQDAISKMQSSTEKDTYDAVIVGSGPAGLAASLLFHEKKKKYLLIEQNTFGGTVANFPRQKLVMSHPFSLPIFGEIKFTSNKVHKEELLKIWNQFRNKLVLNIKEQTRFDTLSKENDTFTLQTSHGSIKAKKVILAMGVRGSPRRLGLQNEDLPKVTYNLLDPQEYKNKEIIVIGGGNAAVEAAHLLAERKLNNKVKLIVRGPNFDRCNEENIAKIRLLEKLGHIEIWYNSILTEIYEKGVLISRNNVNTKITNDFVFIFAGAEMPHKFLMSLGILIDKKFGEAI